jgi:hypothetical protein
MAYREKGHIINNKQDIIKIIIFAMIMAVLWTGYSYYVPYQMGHDQTVLATIIAKDLDPGLYRRDYAFKDDSLYRNYIPLYRQLLRSLTKLTGSFEAGLLSLVPVVVLVYAIGMALLLYRLTDSLWAALLITFLSMPYRPAPPGEIWGVGGVEYIQPRTLATAVAPYLFLLFFKLLEVPSLGKGILLGGLVGLVAFLHPPTALFMGEIFIGLFALTYLRRPGQWGTLGALVLAYGLAALYPLTLMDQQPVVLGASTSFAEFSQVLQTYLKIPTNWGGFPGETTEHRLWLLLGATLLLGLNYLCRPDSQRPRALLHAWLGGGLVILFLCWRIAGKGGGLTWLYALAAIYLVLRYRRGNPQRLDWWLMGMGYLVLAFALIPYYGFTLLWLKTQFLPLTSLVVEHYRAARFIHLFMYLLSARVAVYLVTQLADWLKTSKETVMTEYTLVALSIWNVGLFWVVQGGVALYETLRYFGRSRRAVLAGVTVFSLVGLGVLLLTPTSRHKFWQNLRERGLYSKAPVDLKEDEALFAWARSNTPKDALFYHGSALFRYRGQRSITYSLADLINHRDSRYVDFYRRYRRLEKAYEAPAELALEARRLAADYLVLEKRRPVRLYFPISFENQKYLVYRVPHGETVP